MMQFTNPWGLYALLSLVPLIIIYLIKPKPLERVIPSLMFIIKDNKLTKRQALFKRFVQNLIFFLQFIAISALALTIASPYITIPFATSSENTVLVIDSSASMQASNGISTRFDAALEKARSSAEGKVTIILAENTPVAMLSKGSSDDAIAVLGKLKPRATTTNIGDAMLMADDVLGTEKGKVIVLSDFIPTEGSDIMVAKRRLEASGHSVEFQDFSSGADNVGIIGMDVTRATTKVKVRNFNNDEVKTKVNVIKDGKTVDVMDLSIQPDSLEEVSFNTPHGKTEVVLDRKDDFMLDNRAFISNPFEQKTKVLIVTNLKENNYVEAVMEALPDVQLDVRRPPTINPENLGHDIIIINEVDKTLLVPGDFNLISRHAKSGASVVLLAQNDLTQIDFSDLLPVKLGQKYQSAPVCIKAVNRFTKHLAASECFTRSPIYDATAYNGTNVIATTDGNIPIMVLKEHGNGKVFFYGIFDRESDFKSTSEYPIFWAELVGFLSGTEDIGNFNVKTGEILPVAQQEVETPSGKLSSNKLSFDEAGFYSYAGNVIASNLLSEKESDVGKTSVLKSGKGTIGEGLREEGKKDVSLDLFLIGLVALILLLELVVVKFRGDA